MPGMTEWERRQYEKAGQGSPDTELFKFRGEEYVAQPFQLQLDAARGVLYLHNVATGQTVLRICRIPEEVTRRIPHYGAVLDLHTAVPQTLRVSTAKDWKKAPVFLSFDPDRFFIETESGEIILEVSGVPGQMLLDLSEGKFADITTGHTGRLQ